MMSTSVGLLGTQALTWQPRSLLLQMPACLRLPSDHPVLGQASGLWQLPDSSGRQPGLGQADSYAGAWAQQQCHSAGAIYSSQDSLGLRSQGRPGPESPPCTSQGMGTQSPLQHPKLEWRYPFPCGQKE